MKYYVLFFFVFFSSYCLSQNTLGQGLSFQRKVIDYGKVSNDTTLVAKFIMKNTTAQKITINYVNPECTCTSYYVSKYKIEPNDTASVVLTINTDGKYGKEKIYAIINYGDKRMSKLTVKCNVYEK